jgi:hypothetical protein
MAQFFELNQQFSQKWESSYQESIVFLFIFIFIYLFKLIINLFFKWRFRSILWKKPKIGYETTKVKLFINECVSITKLFLIYFFRSLTKLIDFCVI